MAVTVTCIDSDGFNAQQFEDAVSLEENPYGSLTLYKRGHKPFMGFSPGSWFTWEVHDG